MEDTTLARSLRVARARQALLDLLLLARPLMWLIPLVPFGVGYLMARRRPGASQHPCLRTTFECAPATLTLLVGLTVWGPLICLAVLAINDVYDVKGDSLNPRRSNAPVARGRLSTRSASVIAHIAGIIAILAAAAVRPAFALVTFLFLALGWLYSVPPVRLKVRPGFDVAINAVGDGGLAILAGWTSARAIAGFPWPIFALGCLAAAALYLPTTVADYQSDLTAEYTTVAIRLGSHAVYRIGLSLWTVTGVGCLLLAARGTVFPRQAVWVLAVSTPTLIWLYHWSFGRVHEQPELLRRMGIMGLLSFMPLLLIVLMYVGIV